MPLDDLPALLLPDEVAEVARVSRATVLRWAKDGTLPQVRNGRTIRFRREDVEALLTPKPIEPVEAVS